MCNNKLIFHNVSPLFTSLNKSEYDGSASTTLGLKFDVCF